MSLRYGILVPLNEFPLPLIVLLHGSLSVHDFPLEGVYALQVLAANGFAVHSAAENAQTLYLFVQDTDAILHFLACLNLPHQIEILFLHILQLCLFPYYSIALLGNIGEGGLSFLE